MENEIKTEQNYSYSHINGEVLSAANLEEAQAKCSFLGRLSQEDAVLILETEALGRQKRLAEEQKDLDSHTDQNDELKFEIINNSNTVLNSKVILTNETLINPLARKIEEDYIFNQEINDTNTINQSSDEKIVINYNLVPPQSDLIENGNKIEDKPSTNDDKVNISSKNAAFTKVNEVKTVINDKPKEKPIPATTVKRKKNIDPLPIINKPLAKQSKIEQDITEDRSFNILEIDITKDIIAEPQKNQVEETNEIASNYLDYSENTIEEEATEYYVDEVDKPREQDTSEPILKTVEELIEIFQEEFTEEKEITTDFIIKLQKIEEILTEIESEVIEKIDLLEAEPSHEDIEKLLIEVLDNTELDYSPADIKILAKIIYLYNQKDLIQTMPSEEQLLPTDFGTHEYLQKTKTSMLSLISNIIQFLNIGKLALSPFL